MTDPPCSPGSEDFYQSDARLAMVLATLAFAPHLQELKLEKCAVASHSVALVQNFCSLRALYLDGVSGLVHDAHLAHLNAAFRGATALTSVYLGFLCCSARKRNSRAHMNSFKWRRTAMSLAVIRIQFESQATSNKHDMSVSVHALPDEVLESITCLLETSDARCFIWR